MRDPEVEALINELQDWCKEKYGRNSEIAQMLGVSRQLVSDWFSGRVFLRSQLVSRFRSSSRNNGDENKK
jgi:predicted XRE-type DNA-binding protein